MNRLATAVVTSALLAAPSVAAAQESSTPPAPSAHDAVASFQFEPAVMVPLGDMQYSTGPGVGAWLGVAHRLSSNIQLIGHVGALVGSEQGQSVLGLVNESSSLTVVPVLAGIRYYVLGDEPIRAYVLAEAGPVFVSASARASVSTASIPMAGPTVSNQSSGSDQGLRLGSNMGVGLELGLLDLRVGLLSADLTHASASTAFLTNLGFRFASL